MKLKNKDGYYLFKIRNDYFYFSTVEHAKDYSEEEIKKIKEQYKGELTEE